MIVFEILMALLVAFFGFGFFVWLVWMNETHPDKKHNPPESDSLKCNKPWNQRMYH